MSVSSSSRGRITTELQVPKKWTERETSPERTKVWAEPKPKPKTPRKVSVVYYLSRNGQLEHPHFMEVPLSSPHGLYLKDVINRLNALRGKGMATLYSWSAKRYRFLFSFYFPLVQILSLFFFLVSLIFVAIQELQKRLRLA